MKDKDNEWILTYMGKKFYPFNPNIEDINIMDIAHALSMLCRYTGHIKKFYSVAHHSVLVSKVLKAEGYDLMVQLTGLLHDAPEAYINDIATPVKRQIPVYRMYEEKLANCISLKYRLEYPLPESIIRIDRQAFRIEAKALFPTSEGLDNALEVWYPDIPQNPYIEAIFNELIGLDSEQIKRMFLDIMVEKYMACNVTLVEGIKKLRVYAGDFPCSRKQ